MELKSLEDIIAPYCITMLQYERVKEMPFFKRVYEDFAVEWNRVTSTPDRIRLISAVMLEEGLPRLGSQMIDKEVSPAVAVETGKFFARIAGVGETKGEGTPGEKFVINIRLGDEKLQFTKDVTPRAPTDEALPGEPAGEGSTPALQSESSGESEDTRTQTFPGAEICKSSV